MEEKPLTYFEPHKQRAKKAGTIIAFTILDMVMILWVAGWQWTPLCLIALINIVLAFKKITKVKLSKNLTGIIITGVNFVVALYVAGWDLSLQAFLILANLIILFENLQVDETLITTKK